MFSVSFFKLQTKSKLVRSVGWFRAGGVCSEQPSGPKKIETKKRKCESRFRTYWIPRGIYLTSSGRFSWLDVEKGCRTGVCQLVVERPDARRIRLAIVYTLLFCHAQGVPQNCSTIVFNGFAEVKNLRRISQVSRNCEFTENDYLLALEVEWRHLT